MAPEGSASQPASQPGTKGQIVCDAPVSVPVITAQKCSAGQGKCNVIIIVIAGRSEFFQQVRVMPSMREISFQRPESTKKVAIDVYDKEELGKAKYMPHHLKHVFKDCPETSGVPRDLSRAPLSFPSAEGTLRSPHLGPLGRQVVWMRSLSQPLYPAVSHLQKGPFFPSFSIISFPTCQVRF